MELDILDPGDNSLTDVYRCFGELKCCPFCKGKELKFSEVFRPECKEETMNWGFFRKVSCLSCAKEWAEWFRFRSVLGNPLTYEKSELFEKYQQDRKCPKCGSKEILVKHTIGEKSYVINIMTCVKCNQIWREEYQLSNVTSYVNDGSVLLL